LRTSLRGFFFGEWSHRSRSVLAFAGIATINSGNSTVTITGADIRSESAVFLDAPMFTTNAASDFGRAFAVTSLTVIPPTSASAVGGFVITTVDSFGAGTTARIPWMSWRIQ
jgi:hypothetical protein